MRRLILCADDFAFSPDVSHVIAELATDGKLNATGCMTAMPNWRSDSRLLDRLPPQVEIGLHLVLTLEAPATAMPGLAPAGVLPGINDLARMARRADLPLAEIAVEIGVQIDRFAEAMGRMPDFVDGHQHAHALPGIRDIVLAEVARRAPGAWIRTCAERATAILARPFRGKAVASAAHSIGLRGAAAAHGLSCNEGFAGHYGFAGDYAAMLPRFLARPGARHLVMCHPGAGNRPGDDIAAARIVEAAALRALPIRDMAAAHGLAFFA